ncbi:hypothetical protein BBOV_II003120 [Babesia bovis T2Bo]|uniref:hypothetical protein n=1 Tax=Babesia bovis T2Bo TaxID=484906 RepID=UPI001C34FA97|nr:hypothetical protein BBOV_II003120 [Babesia bovis T2Bo]EDO06267.2 hypothetical protein BBOV_II003120 [Babesia bovis T2Bo]
MSRIFVKQLPILVRQHLPRVSTYGATKVVEALEDAAHLRKRDQHVDKFLNHCVSRALAVLPDLRITGIIRSLFAHKNCGIQCHNFVEEVASFLLHECGTGRHYQSFLDSSTANDVLLLYKAFLVNEYYNINLYTLCMGLLATQLSHMTASDCTIFFKSHIKYIKAYDDEKFTKEDSAVTRDRILNLPLATEITVRYVEQGGGTPEDVTLFAEWLIPMQKYYGFNQEISSLLSKFYFTLSQRPAMFNIDHMHRILQSTCKVFNQLDTDSTNHAKAFMESLLHESERRNDVHTFDNAFNTLCALQKRGHWRFELLKGMLYTVVNNYDSRQHHRNIQELIVNLIETIDNVQGQRFAMNVPFALDLCPGTMAHLKLKHMLKLLQDRNDNILAKA